MNTQKFMRILVIAKLVLVLAAFAIYQGWVRIGDVPLLAGEEEEKSAKDTPKADTEPKEDDTKKEPEKNEAASARKSFLADLFELPKLDPKSARKEEIGKYLDMAERKEKQIKAREIMLAKREEQLKSMERSIDEKLSKMDEERKFIAKTLQDEKDLKGERLEKLITLYDKMEPKKAAPQIEKLDKDLVVALFKGLKQKQVTTILEFMNPDKSVEITEYFGRVKSGREYDLLKELNSSLKNEFAECKGMPEASVATAGAGNSDKKDDKAGAAPKDSPGTAKTEDKKTEETKSGH